MSVSGELQPVVRFGVFEADLRVAELRKNGVKVKIQDLPFRALALLLSRPNRVITREEIRQALWPQDVFVDFDRGINSAVKRLRDALGDSADNPIFIETVDRRGYRWIAPASVAPTSPVPTSPAPASLAAASATDSRPDSASSVSSAITTPAPLSPPRTFPAWKLVYAIPVLTLIFAVWALVPGFHTAGAAGDAHLPASRATAPLHIPNQEAKDLYLQGRYYWNKRTPDDLHKAVDYFTQAIVHDPAYSDAYMGLADSYDLLREYSAMPSREAFPRALAAARKAVELDDHSSQAHASLAFVSFWGQWDAATGDREFRRALELDPNNAIAHQWYATCLATMGRYPEALSEIERARSLDPSSKSILADKGDLLHLSGRSQEALTLLRQMEAAEPEFVSPHRYLQRIYLGEADYPNYLAQLRQVAVLTNDASALIVVTAAEKGLAAGGPQAMFQSMRREQQKLYDQGKLSPYLLAQTCALAGNKDDALKYLLAAYDQRDEAVSELPTDHMFDNLRDEPVLRQILAGIGIPFAQPASRNPRSR